jgi:hypothetical protein
MSARCGQDAQAEGHRGPRAGRMHHVTYETGRNTSADPSGVATRDDFANFLDAVLADFRSAGESEWENATLERFLDGFAAFAAAREVDRDRGDQEAPTWGLFAEMIVAATGYE